MKHYRYWNGKSRKVCVEEMMQDLENAPEQSVVVLSASGHSPTGADLSQDEWKRVIEILVVHHCLVSNIQHGLIIPLYEIIEPHGCLSFL